MKKVLIFVTHNDYMALDLGMTKYQEGYDVYFVGCDKSVGICGFFNPRACGAICKICSIAKKNVIMKLLKTDSERYHYVDISKLKNNDISNITDRMIFKYDNTTELKALEYKGVDIGFAAFSTFVSLTRNVMPSYNISLKAYLDEVLRSEIRQIEALDTFIDEIKPDLVVFHNGRMSNSKPLYRLAQAKGIDFIATEKIPTEGKCIMDNFVNDVRHSLPAVHEKNERRWNSAGPERYKIGEDFFYNRYHSKPAGDTIYTKNQRLGELPDNFDKSKRNIAIFNSSEDEFYSVSKEWDEASLFPTQYIALKTLFERYKNKSNIHFYLRIHPNLASVPYKSHTLLYNLKYDNVTIIPPTSKISSYTLMENVEKVMVFGSTMGLESSYWGKPVITLCGCFYSNEGVVYEPKTVNEMFELIDKADLTPLHMPKETYFKMAFRLMLQVGEEMRCFSCTEKTVFIPIINKPVKIFTSFKLLGSAFLYGLVWEVLGKFTELGLFTKYGDDYIKETI